MARQRIVVGFPTPVFLNEGGQSKQAILLGSYINISFQGWVDDTRITRPIRSRWRVRAQVDDILTPPAAAVTLVTGWEGGPQRPPRGRVRFITQPDDGPWLQIAYTPAVIGWEGDPHRAPRRLWTPGRQVEDLTLPLVTAAATLIVGWEGDPHRAPRQIWTPRNQIDFIVPPIAITIGWEGDPHRAPRQIWTPRSQPQDVFRPTTIASTLIVGWEGDPHRAPRRFWMPRAQIEFIPLQITPAITPTQIGWENTFVQLPRRKAWRQSQRDRDDPIWLVAHTYNTGNIISIRQIVPAAINVWLPYQAPGTVTVAKLYLITDTAGVSGAHNFTIKTLTNQTIYTMANNGESVGLYWDGVGWVIAFIGHP